MTLGAFNSQLFAVVAFSSDSNPSGSELAKATSYSLRRLGPTLAEACQLLWHERLPFGNWSAYGLAKAERELARKAAMPLLYADSSVKGQTESAIKTAVWGLIDTLGIFSQSWAKETSWTELSGRLARAMKEVREKLPSHILPALQDEVQGEGEPCASSVSSSGSSSSSSSDSSDSASVSSDVEPEDSVDLAEFAHGVASHLKVHFLEDDGSLPPCAKGVDIEPDGYGIGYRMLAKRGRVACKTCCARFSTTPEAIAARCAELTPSVADA